MEFKADDYEKKMGECPKHGEQVMWLACKHVAKQNPKEIWLGPNRVAICPACSMLPVTSMEDQLLVACASCIKGKVDQLIKSLPEGTAANNSVKGLEIYEKELGLCAAKIQ